LAKYTLYDKNGDLLERLYQWDLDRVVAVSNVTAWSGATVFIQFGNRKVDETIIVEPTLSDGKYIANIPNSLLSYAENLNVYISQRTQSGETLVIDEIRIPVVPKNMPSDYIYVPNTEDISVPNGLILDGEMLYLSRNGRRIGDGVSISGGESGGIGIGSAILVAAGSGNHDTGVISSWESV